MKILIPVDGSNSANQAVHHVIKLIGGGLPVDLHLINVQLGLTGDVTMFVAQENIDSFHRERSDKESESARTMLDLANVPYHYHRAVGDTAAKIADCVRRNDIEQIVMGSRGMGALANLVLGSVATKVIHLVDVPVTLIKAGG